MSAIKMAAPFTRMCFRKSCCLNRLNNSQRWWYNVALVQQYTQTATSHQTPETPILVPKKKKRDELAVLRALESTVEVDTSAPKYRTMDDPYLIPLHTNHNLQNDLAYISGVKAARFVVDKYPEPFLVRPMEDFSYTRQGFRFKPEPTHSEDTLEGLQERIEMEKTVDAYKSYTTLQEKGVAVPPSVRQDLLDLLCFYNSEDAGSPPIPLENAHRTVDSSHRKKQPFNWNINGLADQMFESLEEPDQQAYSSMLRGRAKYADVQGTLTYLEKMQAANMEVGLKEYNAVLKAYSFVVNARGEIVDNVQQLVTEMAEREIEPDLETFNSLLLIMASSSVQNRRVLALDAIQEMRQCGVEPSLGSYQLLLVACHSAKKCNLSQLLWDIVNELKGKDLTARHPTDYHFFHSMMRSCEATGDLKLAHAINEILRHGKNHHLLATVQNQQSYYFHYLSMVFSYEELDNIMETYYKLVPHTFIPSSDLMQELLKSISLHRAYHHLPAIWPGVLQMFDLRHSKDLISYFLNVMGGAKVQPEIHLKFITIVEKLFEIKSVNERFNFTGQMLGDMCLISLNAGRLDLAWQCFEENDNNRRHIQGFMRHSTLKQLADILLKEKDVPKLMKVCSLLGYMVSPHLNTVIDEMKSQLELTDQQINSLDKLDK